MNPSNTVHRLVAKLRKELDAEMIHPGTRLPSIRVLSKKYEVSTNSISAAISLLEQEGRIFRKPRSGNFAFDYPGQILERPLRIIVGNERHKNLLEDEWAKEVVMGAISFLSTRKLAYSIETIEGSEAFSESESLRRLADVSSGFLFPWSAMPEEALLPLVEQMRIPILKIGRSSHRDHHNFISIDHFGAGKIAGEKAAAGRKGPFLILAGQALHRFPLRQLIAGFIDGLQNGNRGHTKIEIIDTGGTTMTCGHTSMEQFLRQTDAYPGVVFSVGDLPAIGAMRACSEIGLEVPRDVEFISSAGLEATQSCVPTLAHIHQPIKSLGREAMGIMVRMIRRRETVVVGKELEISWVTGESFDEKQDT